MNNNVDRELTCDAQYKKFSRAIRIVFNIESPVPDEFYAFMQLMNELPKTATVILDETHEDI